MTVLRTLIAAAMLAPGIAAELPSIRLDTIFPPGGKAGTEVDAAITGADLDEAKAIHFSHPGITAEAKEKRFIIKIAPDVPPGVYDARVTGLLGISNPRAFVVSDLPQSVEPATNNTPGTAADFAPDSSVCGTATAANSDYFKFTAKGGQRLILNADTAKIDSLLTPVLGVLDANGRELAAAPRGGMLDFTAPADGVFIARIHDLTYAGGPNHFYRLTLTTGPHIDFIMPPCAKPGAKSKFTIYGRNLEGGAPANLAGHDGKPLDKIDVEIDVPPKGDTRADGLMNPAAAAVPGFSYRLKSSNAVFIGFTDLPVVAEQEKLTVPCEVAGQYFPAADTDIYTFDAKKGEVWWIEIISRRMECPTSPFLLVQRDAADILEAYGSDANIGGARFNVASNDPALRFEVKEDGTYRITTRDLFGGSRKDPRNVYRLAIRKDSADFQLMVIAELPPEKKDDRTATPGAALARAGGTIALRVLAFRRDGFAGEIELNAENLPAGVTCISTKIPAGANEGMLLLTCVEKPERWAGVIRLIGKARIGEAEVVREARAGAVRWLVANADNDAVRPRLTRDLALAVSATEFAPVSIAAVEEKRWEIAAGGKVEFPLKITRREGFKEALKLKAAGAPGVEAMKEIEVAPDAANATATIDLATAKLAAGEHVIRFETQTKGKFRGKDVTTTVFSAPIRVAVLPPPAPATAAAQPEPQTK